MKLLSSVLIVLAFGFSHSALATKRFKIGYPDYVKEPEYLFSVLSDVYKKLDIHLEYVRLPSNRITYMMKQSNLDADIARVGGLEGQVSNYVQVGMPLLKIPILLVCKGDVNSPKQKSAVVLRGSRYVENLGLKNIKFESLNNPEELLRSFQLSRMDCIMGPFSVSDIPPIYSHKQVYILNLYHYLNQKNVAYKAELEKELKRKLTEDVAKKVSDEALGILKIKFVER